MSTDMSTAEQKVRAVWELVHRCDGSYRGYPRDVVLVQDRNGHWLDFPSWDAALAFTEERLEEIRQLREEIAYFNYDGAMDICAVPKRIITRLKSILAEKTAGMKPEAWQ